MPKHSAGIILYKIENNILKVLLVHPGGPFWARKDKGAWSIPKGEHTPEEDALTAAKREFKEEMGIKPPEGSYEELGEIQMKGGKKVQAWATKGNLNTDYIKSNMFELQWPPKSGRIQSFPEVDRAEWFESGTAKTKINEAQITFVGRLEKLLGVTQKLDNLDDNDVGQQSLFEN